MIARRVVALAPFLLFGCGGGPAANPPSAVHWGYEGAEGPKYWGDLDPQFAACKSGGAQSPIDLPARPPHAQEKAPASPKWDAVPIRVMNDGHMVKVEDTAPSSFVFEGATYTLKNFHFHSPAEHTIDGRTFDAEMHFVHKSAAGKTVVIALLFAPGRENETLRAMWDAIPGTPNAAPVDIGKTLDVQSFLPRAPRYLRYEGSLTQPPCTEGVTWLVVEPDPDTPLQMSVAQAARLRSATHGATNRPVQPFDGRVIVELDP